MKKIKLNLDLIDKLKNNPLDNVPLVSIFLKSEQYIPDFIDHNFNSRSLSVAIYPYYLYPLKDINRKKIINLSNDSIMVSETPSPYVPFYGASYIRLDALIDRLECLIKSDFKEAKQYKYLEDLAPFFQEYGRGFKKGIELFLENELDPLIKFKADQNKQDEKVFEHIIKNWPLGYFTYDPVFLKNEFYSGKNEGYLYALWAYVMQNNTTFSSIFSERWQELPIKLKHEIIKLDNGAIRIVERKPENQLRTKSLQQNKLSLMEVALLLVYTGDYPKNPTEIAKKYGYTSGKRLKDNYEMYRRKSNRQGDAGKRANSWQIKRIEKVIELLPEDKKQMAKDDLHSLKEKQTNIH